MHGVDLSIDSRGSHEASNSVHDSDWRLKIVTVTLQAKAPVQDEASLRPGRPPELWRGCAVAVSLSEPSGWSAAGAGKAAVLPVIWQPEMPGHARRPEWHRMTRDPCINLKSSLNLCGPGRHLMAAAFAATSAARRGFGGRSRSRAYSSYSRTEEDGMDGPHPCWIFLFGAGGAAFMIAGVYFIASSFQGREYYLHATVVRMSLWFISAFSLIVHKQISVLKLWTSTMRKYQNGSNLNTMLWKILHFITEYWVRLQQTKQFRRGNAWMYQSKAPG